MAFIDYMWGRVRSKAKTLLQSLLNIHNYAKTDIKRPHPNGDYFNSSCPNGDPYNNLIFIMKLKHKRTKNKTVC